MLTRKHPKARFHEISQIEVLGNLKTHFCLGKHFDPVQRKYPDLLSLMTKADQVKGAVEKPCLICRF